MLFGSTHRPIVALFALLFTLALHTEARAQAPERLSTDETLARAMVGHPDLSQSRLQLRRAEVVAKGESSLLSPVLRFDASYLHNEEPTQSLFEEGVRVTDVFRAQSQLIKRFWWGMDVTLQFDTTRFESEQPFVLPGGIRQVQRIGPNYQETLSLTLRQPLLKGFGADVQLAPLRAAEGQLDTARLAMARAASQAVLEVMVAWFELAFAERSVDVRESQLTIAREQREATEALIASGSLAEIELDVVDGRIVLLEESLLVAQNDLLTRRAELARLIGEQPGARLGTEGDMSATIPPGDAEVLVDLAERQNKEIALVREQIEAQKIAAEASGDNVLPQLDLSLTLAQNALSEDGFFDAFGQIASFEASQLLAGVFFTVPLDNGRARAQHDADNIELERLEAQRRQVARQIGQQVRETVRLVDLGHKRTELAQRGVVFSRRALDAERSKFKAGMSTNQQVLQFQDDLQRAEERVLRAEIDLALAKLRLRHLTGTLLDGYGLEVAP